MLLAADAENTELAARAIITAAARMSAANFLTFIIIPFYPDVEAVCRANVTPRGRCRGAKSSLPCCDRPLDETHYPPLHETSTLTVSNLVGSIRFPLESMFELFSPST